MADDKLSVPETAALLVLMVEAKEVSNPELQEKYALTLTGKPRAKLNDLKLVESRKQGRSFVHLLTDAGWARVAEELRNGINAPTGSGGAALRAVAAGLQRYVGRTGTSLAEIFAQDEDVLPEEAPEWDVMPQAVAAWEPTSAAEPVIDVESRIREAYRKLADKPNTWVSLTHLRPLIGDLPRAEVDATLRRMIALPDVHIVPFENQKMLSPEDREAAVIIGDQATHMILIGA
jgi:hypothetical protein